MSPKMQMEQEKRVRREIANSNERRRMKSINAGFENLKSLIPHSQGEKYSKASILQMSCEHMKNMQHEIDTLRNAKTQLLEKIAEMEDERLAKARAGKAYVEWDYERSNKPLDLEVVRSKGRESEIRDKVLEPPYVESPPPKRKKRDTESSDEGISMGGVESGEEALADDAVCLRHRQRWMDTKMHPDAVRPSNHYGLLIAHSQDRVISYPTPVAEVCKPAHQHHHHQQPVARQNLELMVQAIQHLEGDRVFRDHIDDKSPSQIRSEESEKEGSLSDPDEFKSEAGSGCSSPNSPPVVMYSAQLQLASSPRAVPLPAGALPTPTYSEKYPVATDLLHRPIPQQYLRPGVIVHKS